MRVLAVITACAALVVTGCASTHPTSEAGSDSGLTSASAPSGAGATGATGATGSAQPSASATPVDARCPAQLDEGQYNGRQAQPVPSSMVVDWVLRCTVVSQPGGGRVLLVERSDSDPAALLAAVRAPDEPRSSGACPMMRMVVPYFALIQPNGRAWAPKIPLTGCGMPQTGVLQALNKLRFQVISRTPLN